MTTQPKTLSALKSSLLAEFDLLYPSQLVAWKQGVHGDGQVGVKGEIKSFLSNVINIVAEKTAEAICRLIDDIEIQDENTTIEQWKQYK